MSRAKILKKILKTDFELFLISHSVSLPKKYVLQFFILLCMNVKSDPIS